MTAAHVDYATLTSAPRDAVFELLNNRANVADPMGAPSQRVMIYTRRPDELAVGFQGFPYIILPDNDFAPSRQTVDRRSAQQTFTIELQVVACDRGAGDKDGRGNAHMRSITNDILKTILNATNRASLAAKGLCFSNPVVHQPSVIPFNNTLVYVRPITLTFTTRNKVSA